MKKNFFYFFMLLLGVTILAQANQTTPIVVTNYPINVNLSGSGTVESAQGIKELLLSAQKSIDIEPFYINNRPGTLFDRDIIQTIILKANQGVKVKILLDAKLQQNYWSTIEELKSVKNIEIRSSSYYNSGGGVLHSKMIVVDGTRFYIGSHCFDWVSFTYNHELGVIGESPIIGKELVSVFMFDWQHYQDQFTTQEAVTHPLTNAAYQLVISPATPSLHIADAQLALLNLINHATSSIDIEVMNITEIDPYQSGAVWSAFQEALLQAAQRGVKIRLLVSNWEFNSPTMMSAGKSFLSTLQNASSNISIKITNFPSTTPFVNYAYVDHAKDIIIDNRIVWIGNANLTMSYFTHSRNFNFISFNNLSLAQTILGLYNQLWDSSYAIPYTGNESLISVSQVGGE